MSPTEPNSEPAAPTGRTTSIGLPTFYVDSAQAVSNSYTLVLTLGQLIPNEKNEFHRQQHLVLQMSAPFAKILAEVLATQVANYEQKVGPLPSTSKIQNPEGK